MNGIHTALEGTLGQDSELRFTSTGKAVCSFSLAISENRSGGDGAETTWVKCTLWEAKAERLAPTLKKGASVYIEGKLKLDRWQTQDGTERSGLSVSAWLCQPLGKLGRSAPPRKDAGQMNEWDAIGPATGRATYRP